MDAGVDPRVRHRRRQEVQPERQRGQVPADAVAKANADAECPDGNDVEPGILTCRAPGTPAPARSGRPPAARAT